MNDFDFEEDTSVDKIKRFTFLGMFADIIKLFITIIIIYSLYLGGTIGYRNMKVKEQLSLLSELASKTIDDNKIKGIMKNFCLDYEEINCLPKTFKIERTFDSTTVSIKYIHHLNLFLKIPLKITFEPKSKEKMFKLHI